MNTADKARPLRQCAEHDPHPGHMWLFEKGPHGAEYSRCEGVLPRNAVDPTPTQTDIPVAAEPDRWLLRPVSNAGAAIVERLNHVERQRVIRAAIDAGVRTPDRFSIRFPLELASEALQGDIDVRADAEGDLQYVSPIVAFGYDLRGGLAKAGRDFMAALMAPLPEDRTSAADDFETMRRLRFGEQTRDGHVALADLPPDSRLMGRAVVLGPNTADFPPTPGWSFTLPEKAKPMEWDEDFPADSDLAHILMELLPEIDAHLRLAGKHYGYQTHHALGLKGQYADMYRKWALLKRFMWDGEEPTRESLREILRDLIGHALLTIAMLDRYTAGQLED